VLKPEEVAGAAAMVVIKVRVANNIVIIALRGTKVLVQFCWQIDALGQEDDDGEAEEDTFDRWDAPRFKR
jgi:hypothetical protein